jgi:hypothetical protein
MGNTQSNPVAKPKGSFGSVHGGEKCRPGYYINSSKVMYGGRPLELMDSELQTFKKLTGGYAKTNARVFYQGEPMVGADPETFIIVNRNALKTVTDNPEILKMNAMMGMDVDGRKKRMWCMGKMIHK